jgi:hypothetical protein
MRPHMKIKEEGGHRFHDGKCLLCPMTYAQFSDGDSPRRGERSAGRIPEERPRSFIDEE